MHKLYASLIFCVLALSGCGGGSGGSAGLQSSVDNPFFSSQVNALDSDGDGASDSHDDFPNDRSKAASVTTAHRLLTQATFGATEKEIDRIVSIGTFAWINEQLNKPSAYDSDSDAHKTHLERTIEIATIVDPATGWFIDNKGNRSVFNQIGNKRVLFYQMSDWWENALGHPTNRQHGVDQLRQRVAYALSQILVTSGVDSRLKRHGESLAYYHDILTKHAFGNYRTLLGEVSRSATMGVYLSHQGNAKAQPSKGIRPDENFAREIIQLFSIGLYELNLDGSPNRDNNPNSYPDAGDRLVPSYTQKDVEEMSKVMTGWDLRGNRKFGKTQVTVGQYANSMAFVPAYHEDEIAEGGDGKITLLGDSFALNAGADGSGLDVAIDILFKHPNVAPFISRNLITRLVTSNPSSAYIARVSAVFNNNGKGVKGDLKAVIGAILKDEEARNYTPNTHPTAGKIKEPILAWTQLLRAFHVTTLNGWKGVKDADGNRALVDGVYMYYNPEEHFAQAPFRSGSVFNFYNTDYVPSDDYFSNNRLVAPESQILSDQILIEINNRFYYFLKNYERNYLNKYGKTSLQEFAKGRSIYASHLMLINFDRELKLFELALDGDTNGDFANMEDVDPEDKVAYRQKAINALLAHLDKVMLGNTMSSVYKDSLRQYLMEARSLRNSDNYKEAYTLIRESIQLIATSSAYLIQK